MFGERSTNRCVFAHWKHHKMYANVCLSCSLHILQKVKQIQVTARDTSSYSFLCNVTDYVLSTIHGADYYVFGKLNDPFHLFNPYIYVNTKFVFH